MNKRILEETDQYIGDFLENGNSGFMKQVRPLVLSPEHLKEELSSFTEIYSLPNNFIENNNWIGLKRTLLYELVDVPLLYWNIKRNPAGFIEAPIGLKYVEQIRYTTEGVPLTTKDVKKLRENDFPSNAEAESAYFPLSPEQWLAEHAALKRMDKAYCLMEDILGDSITPEQRAYFDESVEIEEMVIRKINEDNFIIRLVKMVIEEWKNPKPPMPLID